LSTNNLRRVLIVDDDQDTRDILSAVLRHSGLLVDEAADGVKAIALLTEQAYAVVVLDILMPGTDGFAVLETLPARPAAERPVVIVTSGANREVLARLDAEQIHAVIRKPFDPEELAAVVTACVEVRTRHILGPMAIASVLTSAPLLALLKL
jgi:CheY-like chemotaxis protein